ncbi:MAG: tetratricopeptide repeat protein [Muribaculaceae bacterium]|jgi:tetratricopeptide (TPR) repeat protein|nr:tetratricopeptide repeat protein [Muribaculaceae bacterium]MBQ6648096.1 tetratricopeptide repeat protein [Muribaculaceae bacterium]
MKTKFFFATMLLACASFVVNAQGYKDGIDFYKIGKLDDAKILLEKYLDDAGTNKAEANYYLGEIAYHKGDLALAQSYYDKGIQIDPKYGFNYVGKGAVALKKGDVKGAENFFKQGEKCSKKNSKLAIAIANAYYYADANAYAKQIKKQTDNAFKWNPADPDYYIFKGDDLGYKKEWGQAFGQYELAYQNEPNNIESRVKAANVDFFLNPTRAIQGLENLLREVPNNALVQRELAEKYYENNDVAKALENYGKYYDNPNHFAKDEVRYAQLLWMNKENDKAIDICNGLIASDDESNNKFFGYRLKLYSQCAKEDWEGALETGKQFFALPDQYNSLYLASDYSYFATALAQLDRADEAVQAFEKAMTIFPDDKSIRNQLVNIYTKNKEFDKAIKLREDVIASGDYTINDLYNLANAYSRLAENTTDAAVKADAVAKGKKAIEEVIEKQPNEVSNYYMLSRIMNLGETAEFDGTALEAYKKLETAVMANKDNKNANYYLQLCYRYMANYYLKQGQNDLSKTYFTKWLELDPNNEQLRKYVEGLNQPQQ